uniref:Uncharacterized protein n=1 Tax=Triticum urartu TaxID=4572 RepID=A0A8R7QJG1_TRIUA
MQTSPEAVPKRADFSTIQATIIDTQQHNLEPPLRLTNHHNCPHTKRVDDFAIQVITYQMSRRLCQPNDQTQYHTSQRRSPEPPLQPPHRPRGCALA